MDTDLVMDALEPDARNKPKHIIDSQYPSIRSIACSSIFVQIVTNILNTLILSKRIGFCSVLSLANATIKIEAGSQR